MIKRKDRASTEGNVARQKRSYCVEGREFTWVRYVSLHRVDKVVLPNDYANIFSDLVCFFCARMQELLMIPFQYYKGCSRLFCYQRR